MDPNVIVQLVSDLGSLGFILYLVHRTTTHTIPRLAQEYLQAEIRLREDFRAMLQQQRDDFRRELEREREIHGVNVSRLIDEIRRQSPAPH